MQSLFNPLVDLDHAAVFDVASGYLPNTDSSKGGVVTPPLHVQNLELDILTDWQFSWDLNDKIGSQVGVFQTRDLASFEGTPAD